MRAGTLLFAALSSCIALAAATAAIELPEGPDRALVYGKCRTCHDLQYLEESAGITRDDWDQMLISMRQYGMRLEPDQRARILDYLGTYLGPNPPPATATLTVPTVAAAKRDGAALYNDQCSACHQPNGQGVPDQFPPLAGNPDLFLARDYPIRVVLYGLEGKISVKGHAFDSAMPPLDVLKNEEIAAIVQYVRSSWGNDALRPKGMKPVDAGVVAAARKAKGGSPQQVFAYRKSLRTGAARN